MQHHHRVTLECEACACRRIVVVAKNRLWLRWHHPCPKCGQIMTQLPVNQAAPPSTALCDRAA